MPTIRLPVCISLLGNLNVTLFLRNFHFWLIHVILIRIGRTRPIQKFRLFRHLKNHKLVFEFWTLFRCLNFNTVSTNRRFLYKVLAIQNRLHWFWWHCYAGDFMMMTILRLLCWWFLMWSKYPNFHHHKPSPTSVTNIDVITTFSNIKA